MGDDMYIQEQKLNWYFNFFFVFMFPKTRFRRSQANEENFFCLSIFNSDGFMQPRLF